MTGVPVKASSEPACAANTSGINSCDGALLSRTAMTTTTGSSAATAPLTLMRAVSKATRSIVSSNRRVRLSAPALLISNWPAQAVTPLCSSPALTTNSAAMKMTAGSPKPARACCKERMPVAQSASGVAMATTTTGSLLVTNRTMMHAIRRPMIAISLTSCFPRRRVRVRVPDQWIAAQGCIAWRPTECIVSQMRNLGIL